MACFRLLHDDDDDDDAICTLTITTQVKFRIPFDFLVSLFASGCDCTNSTSTFAHKIVSVFQQDHLNLVCVCSNFENRRWC